MYEKIVNLNKFESNLMKCYSGLLAQLYIGDCYVNLPLNKKDISLVLYAFHNTCKFTEFP